MARLVVIERGGIVGRGQSDIAIRPDEVKCVPGDACFPGGLVPGKTSQVQASLLTGLLHAGSCFAVNMRLPVEAVEAGKIIELISLRDPRQPVPGFDATGRTNTQFAAAIVHRSLRS